MASCLLVLYWPDFCPGERAAGRALLPLLARSLHRRLALCWSAHAAYVWVPMTAAEEPAAETFRRWGFRALNRMLAPETLQALLQEHPHADEVILAMHSWRAAGACALLREAGRRVQVWRPSPQLSPEEPAEADCPGADRVADLEELLALKTAQPVAIFADWRVVEAAFRRAGLAAEPEAMRERLLRAGELVGAVVSARLYGGWEAGPCVEAVGIAPPEIGRSCERRSASEAPAALRRDLLCLLEDPDTPRTWIVISECPWLEEVIAEAHRRAIRVLLWPAEEGRLSPELRALADGCAELAAALGLPAPAAVAGKAADGREGAAPVELEVPGPAATPAVTPGSRLGPWVRLIYHVRHALQEHRCSRMSFRKLAVVVAEREEFGPTPANALLWLNRAKAEGMLLVEHEPRRSDPGGRVATCRPNPEHPVVKAALEVPDRCLQLLYQMLQRMPWVSFKLLRSVLLREQWLGGAPFHLDEESIDEWLNFLIHDGAIRMTKEPNLVNPEHPVTALRLSEEHPLARAIIVEAMEGQRLAAERAVLTVDHFTIRHRKPWMSMSALRRALESLGREELQEVLQGLHGLGALCVESYPNPRKEHFTTGCRLQPDQPLVAETLAVRNTLVRVIQQHQRHRNWVPLSQVDADLDGQQAPVPAPAHRLAWFLLLRDEGILELDHEGPVPESGWGNVRCRLNLADPVVRSIIAQAAEGAPGSPGGE